MPSIVGMISNAANSISHNIGRLNCCSSQNGRNQAPENTPGATAANNNTTAAQQLTRVHQTESGAANNAESADRNMQANLTPYEQAANTFKNRVFRSEADGPPGRLPKLSKEATARLQQLNSNKTDFKAAKACLDNMKPDIRAKYVELLEREYELGNTSFYETGLTLTQWNELFEGEGMPFTIIVDDNSDTDDWILVNTPNSIRAVDMKEMNKGNLYEAWGNSEAVTHTKNIMESIMTNGLKLAQWAGWSGSVNEGRHRSCAGIKMGADMLHPSLIRLPVKPDDQSLLG